jgi:hypothetical protein
MVVEWRETAKLALGRASKRPRVSQDRAQTGRGKDREPPKDGSRTFLAITQGQRNFFLTILAAVYLPLFFVTSLFGMNMNTTTPEGRVDFSEFTNSTLAHLPGNLANSTEALISTISASGFLTWGWKTFGIIDLF